MSAEYLWSRFDKYYSKLRKGISVEEELSALAEMVWLEASEHTLHNPNEYKQLCDLFFHIQESLIIEYGKLFKKELPIHPCATNVNFTTQCNTKQSY